MRSMHLFLCELTGMHGAAPATAAIEAAHASQPSHTLFPRPKTLTFDAEGQQRAQRAAGGGETPAACSVALNTKSVLMAMPLETALLLVGTCHVFQLRLAACIVQASPL